MVKTSRRIAHNPPSPLVELLDYRKIEASNNFVPHPAKLGSLGWDSIHLELHQQPQFETREHQHNMHVIALCMSQSPGERWLDGKIKPERRNLGDIAIIPHGIVHRCNWNNWAQFGILAIEPKLLQEVSQDLIDSDRLFLIPQFMNQQDELIRGIFAALKDELESSKMASNLLIDSLKTTLAIHLLRNYCTTKPKLSSYSNGLSKLKLKQLTEYIREHLDRDLKVVELAAIAKISSYHFIRLFKNATGKTPHQYILEQRVIEAQYLLRHQSCTIAEIAAAVGFCDQSHFTKYFKRITGVTPKQYQTKSQ